MTLKSGPEIIMELFSNIVGGYGTEAIFCSGVYWPDLVYVNTGDACTATIIWDERKQWFAVSTYGDEMGRYRL